MAYEIFAISYSSNAYIYIMAQKLFVILRNIKYHKSAGTFFLQIDPEPKGQGEHLLDRAVEHHILFLSCPPGSRIVSEPPSRRALVFQSAWCPAAGYPGPWRRWRLCRLPWREPRDGGGGWGSLLTVEANTRRFVRGDLMEPSKIQSTDEVGSERKR